MEEAVEETFDMDKLIQAVKAQVLSPKEGDVILIQLPEALYTEISTSKEHRRTYTEMFSALFPNNTFITLGGIDILSKDVDYIKELRATCDELLSRSETIHADGE